MNKMCRCSEDRCFLMYASVRNRHLPSIRIIIQSFNTDSNTSIPDYKQYHKRDTSKMGYVNKQSSTHLLTNTSYTHYYTIDNTSSPEWEAAWPQLVEDAQRIIDNSNVPLSGPDFDDPGPPIIDVSQGIFLNGVGDDGHEPLCLDRHGNAGFSFVKTARKLYDEVVACILLRAAVLAPNCVSLE